MRSLVVLLLLSACVAVIARTPKIPDNVFDALWKNYPHSDAVLKKAVSHDYKNACALRLSYALNAASQVGGLKWAVPSRLDCPDSICREGYVYTLPGTMPGDPDKKAFYSMRVQELGYVLEKQIGKPDLIFEFDGEEQRHNSQLEEKIRELFHHFSGIVKFDVDGFTSGATGHFDLWSASEKKFANHGYLCLLSGTCHEDLMKDSPQAELASIQVWAAIPDAVPIIPEVQVKGQRWTSEGWSPDGGKCKMSNKKAQA